jgi:membrane protease YdiL (CAAX protease family)
LWGNNVALRDPVAAYNAKNNLEAQLVSNLLNNAGIESFVTEDASVVGITLFGPIAEVHKPQIWIDRSDLAQAKPVLDDYERRNREREAAGHGDAAAGTMEPNVTCRCEDCGEQMTVPARRRGYVETCPHCGEFVDVPEDAEPAVATVPADQEAERVDSSDVPTNTRLWLEVAAILCLAVIPELVYAIESWLNPGVEAFWQISLYWLARSLQVSAPILFILWVSREPWSQFGIVRPRWFLDAFFGLVLWSIATSAYWLLFALLPKSFWETWRDSWPGRQDGIVAAVVLIAALVANSVAEELVARGYLIPRFQRLLGSTPAGIIVAALLFASYHCYQGTPGVVNAALFGIIYGTWFRYIRRLWPLIVAHTLTNLDSHW